MPLFKCSACGSMDNTALTRWAMRFVDEQFQTLPTPKPALCSACDPAIGHWHDRFPRVPWDEAQHGPHDIERMCK